MTLCLVTDKGSLKLWCCMVKSILVKFVLTVVHLVPSVEYRTWYTLGNNTTTKLHPKLISFRQGENYFKSNTCGHLARQGQDGLTIACFCVIIRRPNTAF